MDEELVTAPAGAFLDESGGLQFADHFVPGQRKAVYLALRVATALVTEPNARISVGHRDVPDQMRIPFNPLPCLSTFV
jgi:hypothetical protein